MKRKLLLCFGIIASIAGLAGFLLACGSGPSAAGEGLPAWVTSTPEDTDESVYFIGIGTSDTGDVAEAENMAASSMMTEITRFLGVRITAETSVEARDTLETYEQEMTQKIKEESAAQIGDFRVVEKHIEREDGRVTVYILSEYDRDALLKEQKRIQAVFAEQREAISGPEREGDMLVDEEEYYKAARKYIEAASAAATSKVDNAAIKLERNINKAMKAIDFVNLFPLSSNLVTNVKESFDRPFSCKVAAGSSKNAPGVPGANVRIVYKEMQRNNRMGIESVTVQADEDGIVSYDRPAPKFVGTESLTMMLDFGSYMESLEDAPDRFQQYVEGLEELISNKRITIEYTVISRAKEIPTGTAMMDVDRAGNARNVSDSQAGLLESLSEAGFRVRPLELPVSLQNSTDREIITAARNRFGNQVERIIFGVASISEFSEDGGNYIVKVSGTVKAADLQTGEILFTGSSFKRSRGSNTQSALSAAFKGLGRELGKEMAAGLP